AMAFVSTDKLTATTNQPMDAPSGFGNVRLQTTYTYTPVPEPGSGVLLAAGILMLRRSRPAS
ncbi:MAG: PEP-CTERM sorting domain-containing protein, partial [bacterium]|nr:PEP-CTERM sorting domain-containing protein [bacterium]